MEDYKKKYENAIEVVKKYRGTHILLTEDVIEEMFPELKESEDEEIRKGIIRCVKGNMPDNDFCKKYIAWLEKQGEHAKFRESIQIGDEVTRNKDGMLVNLSKLKRVAKPNESKQGEQKPQGKSAFKEAKEEKVDNQNCVKPADKVKVKFKVGDWVVNTAGDTNQVVKVFDDGYALDDNTFISNSWATEHYHLWTIQDAKDGDVLINWNNTILIFKAIKDETVKFHIAYNEMWDAIKTPSTKLSHLGLPEPQFEFHPATKEQRDLLFAKMKEAGYEWDYTKKKLRKIKQESAWSKEDELKRSTLIHVVKKQQGSAIFEGFLPEELIDWLESLRPQNKQDWLDAIGATKEQIYTIAEYLDDIGQISMAEILYGIHLRNHWKPSDDQMKALADALSLAKNCGEESAFDLRTLHEQLKKLREE